eukprot:7378586-Prymnesium_polylepis.2
MDATRVDQLEKRRILRRDVSVADPVDAHVQHRRHDIVWVRRLAGMHGGVQAARFGSSEALPICRLSGAKSVLDVPPDPQFECANERTRRVVVVPFVTGEIRAHHCAQRRRSTPPPRLLCARGCVDDLKAVRRRLAAHGTQQRVHLDAVGGCAEAEPLAERVDRIGER